LHVGLHHEVERGDLAALHHGEDVLEAGTAGEAHRVLLAGGATPVGARLGDRARGLLVGRGAQLVARERDVVETEHLHRGGRAGLLHLLTVLVEHGAHLAPRTPATIGVADRSVPRSTSAVTTGPRPWSRFDSSTSARAGAFGFAASVGRDVGHEQDRLEQLVDADPAVAATSLTIVSPPHSSGTSSCSTSCC
jgi:hypothetical protein